MCEGGPLCKVCPLYGSKHYVRADGPARTDCFVVCEAPTVGPSTDAYKHIAWSNGLERNVKSLLNAYRTNNAAYRDIEMFFTYAVHCEVEKPATKAVECCSSLLRETVCTYTDESTPIVVLAFGPTVLKSLGVKFGKHADVVGQMMETSIGGRTAYVFASISLKQMIMKAGYVDIVNQHIHAFMTQMLLVKLGKHPRIKSNIGAITKDYIFPKTIAEVEKLVDYILSYSASGQNPERNLLAIDTETNTLYPHRKKLKLLSLTVSWDSGKAASIPVEHKESSWDLAAVRGPLARLLNSPNPKVGHNIKYDTKVLLRKEFYIRNIMWDTMVGEHLLAEDKKGFYGLKELTRRYLPDYANYETDVKSHKNETLTEAKKEAKIKGVKLSKAEESLLKDDGYADIPLSLLNTYGAIDSDVTRQIALMQRKAMYAESQEFVNIRKDYAKSTNKGVREMGEILWTTEDPVEVLKRGIVWDPLIQIAQTRVAPTLMTLARMENRGVYVDRPYTQELAIRMEQSSREAIIKLNEMLPATYGDDFNPASSPQIRNVLYNTGFVHPVTKELTCYEGKIAPPKTDKGAISTNAQFLRLLLTQYECPFARALLEFRAMQKARNTFVENILVLTREDNAMHTHYHQHGY
jgi:hypothetical protein